MSRLLILPAVCLVVLAGLSLTAVGQEVTLDLSINNINFVCLGGDSALLEAEVKLTTTDAIGSIYTTVGFSIDDADVGSAIYDVVDTPAWMCHSSVPPDCDGSCEMTEINGTWTTGVCVQLVDKCACMYLIWKPTFAATPSDFSTVTATIDPDDTIAETDENNNSMTIATGPSASRGSVWGTIKALYR
jgi:hypothetical protein